MAVRITSSTSVVSDQLTQRELYKLFNAAQADLAALRANLAVLTAKLDADAGVTDTNYGTLVNIAEASANLIK
jgi:hypothetical protein